MVPGLPGGGSGGGGIQIPKELRDTLVQLAAPPTTALAEAGVLPLMNQLVHALEQIPQLIDEVSECCAKYYVVLFGFVVHSARLVLIPCSKSVSCALV